MEITLEPTFLFLGEAAWADGENTGLWVDGAGRLGLQPLAAAGHPPAPDPDEPAALALSLAFDGRLFWIEPNTFRIWVRHRDRQAAVPCIGGTGAFKGPRGLCAGPRDALYVADTGNDRIQVYALNHYQLIASWQVSEPRALAGAPDGATLYCVDGKAHGIVALDTRDGRVMSRPGEGLLVDPQGLAVDETGRILVADPGLGCVLALHPDGTEAGRYSLERSDFRPTTVAAGHGWLWAGDGSRGRLEQFTPAGRHVGAARDYRGPVTDLLVDPFSGRLLLATGTGPAVPLLPDGGFGTAGSYISPAVDSKQYDCQWHKLVIQGVLPEGTGLRVQTQTAPVEKLPGELFEDDWSPAVLLAGPDQGDMDLAVFSPPGRYLWVRLSFRGDGAASPAVSRVRAYRPRSTYAQHLPSVYRSDPAGADFLDRLMLLTEHFLGRWEAVLDDLPRLLAPLGTDREFLPWLASWLDFTLDSRWPESLQRDLLLRAIALYQRRGTPDGLLDFLHLYTRRRPTLVEGFTRRGYARLNKSRLGQNTVLPGGPEGQVTVGADTVGNGDIIGGCSPFLTTGAHQFTVYSYQYPGQPADEAKVLNRVIQAEKPAQTVHRLCEVAPAMRVGLQSLIGVDTVLADSYPPARLERPLGGLLAAGGPSLQEPFVELTHRLR
ncbi:MAG: Phage tail protein [Firmicutes bacterium]|nr:Phage tail protein [Bacillota bacterium]